MGLRIYCAAPSDWFVTTAMSCLILSLFTIT